MTSKSSRLVAALWLGSLIGSCARTHANTYDDRSTHEDSDDTGLAGLADASVSAFSDAGSNPSDAESDPSTDAARHVDGGRGEDLALHFSCPPQRASGSGADCGGGSVGFAWNGAACKEISCDCKGEDCANIYPTRAACEAAFAACPPAGACANKPWYQCHDFCPKHWALHGGGRSFGLCTGDCRFELTLEIPIVLDVGGCDEFFASLRIHNTNGSVREVQLWPTDAALQEAALLSLAIENAALEPVYGCPDCNDGGEAWFSRLSDETASVDTFRYEYGHPPAALQPLDDFVQSLISQAISCKGEALATCIAHGPDNPETTVFACGASQPIASSICNCPVDFDQLGTLHGTACDASCGACIIPDSTCGAHCTQPCASGTPSWSAYCGE